MARAVHEGSDFSTSSPVPLTTSLLMIVFLVGVKWCLSVLWCWSLKFHFSFFFFFFNFICEREQIGEGAEGENLKQAPHSAPRLMRGSILRPGDYDLSRDQESDAQLTEPPRRAPLKFLLIKVVVFII